MSERVTGFMELCLMMSLSPMRHDRVTRVQCTLGLNGDRVNCCTLYRIHQCENKFVIASKTNCLSVTAINDAAYFYSRVVQLISIYLFLKACETI